MFRIEGGNNRIVIGSMTLPFAVSDSKRKEWLEEWIYSSTEGILGLRTVQLFFSYKKDINDTYEFLSKDKVWILIDGYTFIAPNGTLVEMNHSEFIEKEINRHKQQFKK